MPAAIELIVRGLRLSVKLGCGDDERRAPQPVDVDIGILFQTPPRGCETDELKETVCYDDLSRRLKNAVSERSFKLVEHLGHVLYHDIKSLVPTDALLALRVVKLHPPVEELRGGVAFVYADWKPSW